MGDNIWPRVLDRLAFELTPQQFNTWIRPLQVEYRQNISGGTLQLFAPNRFVLDWVREKFLVRIDQLIKEFCQNAALDIELNIGSNGAQMSAQEVRHERGISPNPSLKNISYRSEPNQSAEAQESKLISHNTNDVNGEFMPVRQLFKNDTVPHDQHSSSYARLPSSVLNVNYDIRDQLKKNESSKMPSNNDISKGSQDEYSLRGHDKNPDDRARVSREFDSKRKTHVASGVSNQQSRSSREIDIGGTVKHKSNLNLAFTFDSFVEGKSNQLARAAAMQVADNPGGAYNPLFLYGGVGLGKTHLMHAIGNQIMMRSPNAKVVYLHSERFVADMVKALQINAINEFKRFYRTVDALLIDDIQFFAGKDRSQEEFFHTFNALLEGGQQMILTSDRYPKEITDVEERLKSRFGWGLTVAVEPPELETRVAILMKKAEETRINLPHEAAFFIAKRIRSNVRELEGALKRVVANAHFTGQAITLEFVRESLKDLLAIQDKQVSVDNIQKTVADYFKIKVGDILSKRRSRSVARPRQVAMALSKELTNHSLPEIGDAFGGRDHTTVLHACRKIRELCEEDSELKDDYVKLLQMLTG